jgi:hypothetical protein
MKPKVACLELQPERQYEDDNYFIWPEIVYVHLYKREVLIWAHALLSFSQTSVNFRALVFECKYQKQISFQIKTPSSSQKNR